MEANTPKLNSQCMFRLIVVAVTLCMGEVDNSTLAIKTNQSVNWVMSDEDGVAERCQPALQLLLLIHTALLVASLVLEVSMAWLALQGTMWDVHPRRLMEHVLYGRLSNNPSAAENTTARLCHHLVNVLIHFCLPLVQS